MKLGLFSAVVLGLALGVASAQDAPSTAPAGQTPSQGAGGQRGGRGGRGSHGGWGSGFGADNITGTVTEVAADHYTIKTDAGQTYTIHFSANTRILKQTVQRHGEGGEGGGNPPQMLKSSDIKAGDIILAAGETDAIAKSVGAVVVVQLDPERVKQLREQQASFGKTWLLGKVTAVDGVKVTLLGRIDNAAHAFQVDENTSFRKHNEPVTLGDLQVGDIVRVEGAVKGGNFVAASVTILAMPPGGTPNLPRDAPQPTSPQSK
jgi:hypothetical protein